MSVQPNPVTATATAPASDAEVTRASANHAQKGLPDYRCARSADAARDARVTPHLHAGYRTKLAAAGSPAAGRTHPTDQRPRSTHARIRQIAPGRSMLNERVERMSEKAMA